MSFSQMTTAAFSPGRKNVEELLATARRFGDGSGNKRKQSRADARCAHNWTSPVTSRSEQPTPVTHFAITCETSTGHRRNRFLLIFYPFRSSRRFLLQSAVLRPPYRTFSDGVNITPRRPHRWLIIRRRDLARSIPISTSNTRLGSSLTISGARKGRRWL